MLLARLRNELELLFSFPDAMPPLVTPRREVAAEEVAPAKPMRPWIGLAVYIVATFSLSWLTVFGLRELLGPLGDAGSDINRLFVCSLIYFIAMGWQPILALFLVWRLSGRKDSSDNGLLAAKPRFIVLGAALATGLVLAAAALAWLASANGLYGYSPVESVPVDSRAPVEFGQIGLVMVMLAGSLVFLWLQAFTEEIGWRGFFLVRMMRVLGPWGGLVLHGMVWGFWYAPLILYSSGDVLVSVDDGFSFVVTCFLLGILLGWLRLASSSVVPAVVANIAITVGASMPYFLIGGTGDTVRAAVLGPIGWGLMLVLAMVMLATPYRRVVRVPVDAGTPFSRKAVLRMVTMSRQ